MILGVVIYYIQEIILGYCVLTRLQFGRIQNESTFFLYYLAKLGLRVRRRTLVIVTDFILPPLVIVFAVLWQVVMGRGALLR